MSKFAALYESIMAEATPAQTPEAVVDAVLKELDIDPTVATEAAAGTAYTKDDKDAALAVADYSYAYDAHKAALKKGDPALVAKVANTLTVKHGIAKKSVKQPGFNETGKKVVERLLKDIPEEDKKDLL